MTLTEGIIVIGLLGVVALLALPAFQKARAASQPVACMNHLRAVGISWIRRRTGFFAWKTFRYNPAGEIPRGNADAVRLEIFQTLEDLAGEAGQEKPPAAGSPAGL